MSSTADTETATPSRRPSTSCAQGLLAALEAELGDAVVGSHLEPGDDLWVRVAHRRLARPPAWRRATSSASTYFASCRRSTGCRRRSGKGEDDPTRTAARALDRDSSRASPAASTRFQVFARVVDSATTHVGSPLKVRRPRRHDDVSSVDARLRRRRLARARDLGDVRHRLRRPSRPAPHLPAVGDFEGHPAAQGLPAARPHGEAVAGHRRRRAHAGPATTRARGRPTHDRRHRPPAARLHRRPGRRRPRQRRARDRGHDPQHRAAAPGHPRHAAHHRAGSTASRSCGPTRSWATCTAATRSSPRSAPTRRSRRSSTASTGWASFANEVPFILAAEKLMEVEAPPRAQWIRTILFELARIANIDAVPRRHGRAARRADAGRSTRSATASTCSTRSRRSPAVASTRTSTASAA